MTDKTLRNANFDTPKNKVTVNQLVEEHSKNYMGSIVSDEAEAVHTVQVMGTFSWYG